MKDFLSFHRMLTPVLIPGVFILGVALCVLVGFALIAEGLENPYRGELQVIVGSLLIFVGPLLLRVSCELVIVVFRIHQTLTEIKKNSERKP